MIMYIQGMSLPENIAVLTEDPLVAQTWEAIAAAYGREDLPLLSARQRELAVFLADAGALTAPVLAALVLDTHDRAMSGAPGEVSAALLLHRQELPRTARARDLHETMLVKDTTAAMLNHAVFLLKLREMRTALCDRQGKPYDDDALQVQYFMNVQVEINVLSSLSGDAHLARFPAPFLLLCAREANMHLDTVCKLDNRYIEGVGHYAMEMTDALSHFSARAEGFSSAFAARQAREAAAAQSRATLQEWMRRGAQRFKL